MAALTSVSTAFKAVLNGAASVPLPVSSLPLFKSTNNLTNIIIYDDLFEIILICIFKLTL